MDTKKRKKSKKHLNDLLLPIIFTACILPYTVYLKEYEYGYGEYAWHSSESIMQDFYTYYRMWFFLFIVVCALVILAFRIGLYREKTKSAKIFIPYGIYLLFALLSAVCSFNQKAAWLGNFVDLEGYIVLAGYAIIAFYTYQIMEYEQDYITLLHAFEVSFIPMSVVGWLQVFGKDLLQYAWMQKLVMPDVLYEYYEGEVESIFSGNNVFLTLYNPNYAVIYLLMFLCVFAVFAVCSTEKKQKITALFLAIDAMILIWFTYSRAALVALAVVVAVSVVFACTQKKLRKQERNLSGTDGKGFVKTVWITIGGGVVLACCLIFVDVNLMGGKFLGRIFDEKKDNQLENILTTKEGIEIQYAGNSYILSFEEGEGGVVLTDSKGLCLQTLETEEGSISLPIIAESEATVLTYEGEKTIALCMYGNVMLFAKNGDTYVYKTSWGKEDQMIPVAHVDFGGLEYLGSGRLYIWSRILPILKNYLFVGSGPDTFAEVFPQNDYAGKLVYAKTPARIIERAHNDYLMKWVQTGLCSVMALLAFYVVFLKVCGGWYRKHCVDTDIKAMLGFGCFLGCIAYMVCGFFSDSTLYTTPLFAVFLGLTLSVCTKKG